MTYLTCPNCDCYKVDELQLSKDALIYKCNTCNSLFEKHDCGNWRFLRKGMKPHSDLYNDILSSLVGS